MKVVRRCLLIELDVTGYNKYGHWSAAVLTAVLNERLPGYDFKVWGEVGRGEVDGAFRKLRQLSAETEAERSLGDRVHSANKALSFFREMFPINWWKANKIGEPRS